MHSQLLLCPPVGHKLFEKSLPHITLGDVQQPSQTTKYIRPYECVKDSLGMIFQSGELQKLDYQSALCQFAYPNFLRHTFTRYADIFRVSECRVYQFQTQTSSSGPFVFGMFITDGMHNLIDFCVDSPHTAKRKTILLKLIRTICTPASVAVKLNH